MRSILIFSTITLLLFFTMIGCNLLTSEQSEPTSMEPVAGKEEGTETITGNLATQEQPLDSSSGPIGDLDTSPSYSIYVGMNQQGFCGPTTNSGWFSGFQFDSVFHNVRFVPPGPGNPFPNGGFYTNGAVLPLQSVHGEGDIGSFAICPDYDGVANENSVTMGPKPFEPSLQVIMDEDLVAVPIVGDTGPHVAIMFDMGSAVGGGPMMEWESNIAKGVLGAPFDRFSIVFSVGWNSIMAGEDFEVGAVYEDEGEHQDWTMRFIPQND